MQSVNSAVSMCGYFELLLVLLLILHEIHKAIATLSSHSFFAKEVKSGSSCAVYKTLYGNTFDFLPK